MVFPEHSNDFDLSKESNAHKPFYRRPLFWAVILIIVVMVILIRQCHSPADRRGHSSESLSVVVSKAERRDVPIYLAALGTVTPTYSVTVRTQINGRLMKVLFREGQMVKAGDLLAQIDARPFEAQLLQYQGQLARDKAQLVNAKLDLKRYRTLWRQDSVSQQTLATQEALVKQLEGTIKQDQGLLESVKVNLIYCKITSPITGRIGLRLVDPGNFIQTSDVTGIAVVNMLNPITVVFTIPEDDISQVMESINDNQLLQVEAYDRQKNKLIGVGKVLTIDNQIDTTTGTVKLKAQFKNDKNQLFPSQFVNVRLLVKTVNKATVVPTAAIQHTTKGALVYMLNKDSTVKTRSASLGPTIDEYTVITSGITPGESVVVDGIDKLIDGAKVKVVEAKQGLPANVTGKTKEL